MTARRDQPETSIPNLSTCQETMKSGDKKKDGQRTSRALKSPAFFLFSAVFYPLATRSIALSGQSARADGAAPALRHIVADPAVFIFAESYEITGFYAMAAAVAFLRMEHNIASSPSRCTLLGGL